MKSRFLFLGTVILMSGSQLSWSRGAEVISIPATTNTITAAAGNSWRPILTGDGRRVVFLSHANNLVTNDNPRSYLEVFARDLTTSNTTLVSVNASGTSAGKGDSADPAISADGRFVLFASDADDLVPNDTNRVSDIFLRDLQTGATHLISATPAGYAPGSIGSGPQLKGSSHPVMTPDGRWVAFDSTAGDLVDNDTNGIPDVFIRDTIANTTQVISAGAQPATVNYGNFQTLEGRSHSPSVTPDGRRVAFVSTAANLLPGLTNSNGAVYVRDLQNDSTFWVSSNLAGYFNDSSSTYRCFHPIISSDGTRVAFKASLNLTSAVSVFCHDLTSGMTTIMATNSRPDTTVALSADGRTLAFEENDNIYLRDPNGLTSLVSVNCQRTGPANGPSRRPVITPDGHHIAFVSYATDLISSVPPATNISRLYVRDLVSEITRLVGVSTNGNPSAFDMEGVLPSLSDDGRFVAFDTDAPDLVPNDFNRAHDVFVRDMLMNTTELVSIGHTALPSATGVQSAGTFAQSLSADGRQILFSSLDDPRTPFDTNGYVDAFVRDLVNNTVTALSVGPGAPPPTNGSVFEGLLSANGEAAVFVREMWPSESLKRMQVFWRATSGGPAQEVAPLTYDAADRFPVALSPDGETVVYKTGGDYLSWKNMTSGSNGFVSLYNGGLAPAGPSLNPAFSHNGRFVAFASSAGNLVSNSLNLFGRHMYIRDLQSNVTHLISLDSNGAPLPRTPGDPAGPTAGVFSGNDRFVVFDGIFGTNRQPHVYRYDLQTGQNQLITSNGFNPAINYDGQVLAYNENYRSILVPINIYVMDLATGQGRSITTDYLGNNIPNRRFNPPLLSSNGRYVVFSSDLENLVLQDTNRRYDVFVHDRLQGTTTLISRSRFGPRSAAGISSKPAMSADGRTFVFQSFANDLVEGDYNERRDVFVVRLGTGDSDNDGMDDDWEVAFFGNLSRDGTADFDHDGHSDLQEFLVGTDPTNTGSILRVITVAPMSGGNTTIVWSAVPGRSYVVQFKDALDTPNWSNASGVLTASLTSESFSHPSSSSSRFYRVISVQ